LILGFRHKLMN